MSANYKILWFAFAVSVECKTKPKNKWTSQHDRIHRINKIEKETKRRWKKNNFFFTFLRRNNQSSKRNFFACTKTSKS